MPPKTRIEIYIPTFYNPDKNGKRKAIETRKHRHVKNEIVTRYGAVSMHSSTVEGIWIDPQTGETHFDSCKRFEVCVDSPEAREADLMRWKAALQTLYQQISVYMI